MKLATVRTPSGTAAVRLDADAAVHLGAPDVGALLLDPEWQERAGGAAGERMALDGLDYAPLVPVPDKIICVGLNYKDHIEETGRDVPAYPTLFSKFASSLIGAYDDIVLPLASGCVDWEAELAVVIGAPARHVAGPDAEVAIAGYTVFNDVSVRDWQHRTLQWLQGKTFEATNPVGPVLVTRDELGPEPHLPIRSTVGDEVMQDDTTAELLFTPTYLVEYASTFTTLRPGDLIATGTPGGVGHARTPPRYLGEGDVLTTTIDGIGECRNRCRREAAPPSR